MTLNPDTHDMSHWLEDAWMDRYLERRLTDAESEWFEAYLLTRPRLVARLEADNDLREGLAAAGNASASAPAAPAGTDPSVGRTANPNDGRVAPLPRSRHTFAISGFALAASVAIAAVLGALTVTRFGAGSAAPVDAFAIASPPRVVFDTMRGEASDAVLHAGNPASRYVLVEVSLPAAARDAVFVGSDGRELSVSAGVDGFASVLVPAAGLVGAAPPRLRYSVDGRAVERVLKADYAGLLAPR
jgi:hypothetical protein